MCASADDFVHFDLQVKRHVKPVAGTPGGVLSAESPLHISNVNLVDPASG